MALIFMDGFDHYATEDFLKKWSTQGAIAVTVLPAGGRRSGGALHGYGQYGPKKNLKSALSTIIVGFAVKGGILAANVLLSLQDAAVIQVQFSVLSDGSIRATRSTDTVLGTSAPGLLTAGSWNYVEFKTTIHPSAGVMSARVNGVSVLNLIAQNTRSSANSSCASFTIGGVGAANDSDWDDLYVCDNSGSTNNDFLGDVRVDTLFPNADGTYSQFTPSTGVSHFALVDETVPNTTDYNTGVTTGDRDSYNMGNLAALASQIIYGVQVNAAVIKDDAGSRSIGTFVRSGTTDSDGASAALGTSQAYVSQVFETNPNGAIAWTEATVNAMEAGVKVTA